MPTIVRTTNWETFTTLLTLPETATVDVEEHETGSRTYLAGHVDVDGDTIATFLADPAAERFLVLEDDTYVRIVSGGLNGEDAGILTVDQSRETMMPPPEGGDPVLLRVIEPSPPTTPWSWFFDEVARAFADLNA
ncbi:hypothetical protein [Nocardia aurea]|uniref:hypothetical protein n=1 Tax=Nocardia aurea TaxID=2144174 RepID=UPI0033A477AB